MRKKRLFLCIAIILSFVIPSGPAVNAVSQENLKLYVNQKSSDMEAKKINGEVYIPARALEGNPDTGIRISDDGKTVHIYDEKSVSSIIKKVGLSVVGVIGNVRSADDSQGTDERDGMAFGTGVIIKSNGYIITNTHVVKDMENIIVVLSDGKAYQARLKAFDEKTDLAMIKIDKGTLIPAEFGDVSDIQVGEPVVAIGTPLSLSLRNSATKGIISGLNRSIESDYKFIQSDAAINGGNSGGPIVNMQGKVIGINSVKYTGVGVEGLTFSIPIDTVTYAISHFMKYGKIKRPYLGAVFAEGIAARYGLPSSEGLTVSEIEENSPAGKYGLKEEDIVTAVNGTSVTAIVDFNEEMKKYLPGSSAVLTVKRNDRVVKIKVFFGSEPEKQAIQ